MAEGPGAWHGRVCWWCLVCQQTGAPFLWFTFWFPFKPTSKGYLQNHTRTHTQTHSHLTWCRAGRMCSPGIRRRSRLSALPGARRCSDREQRGKPFPLFFLRLEKCRFQISWNPQPRDARMTHFPNAAWSRFTCQGPRCWARDLPHE